LFVIPDKARSAADPGPRGAVLPGFRMPEIDVMAIYPSRRHLSAKVRVMVDFLAEAFRGVPARDRDD